MHTHAQTCTGTCGWLDETGMLYDVRTHAIHKLNTHTHVHACTEICACFCMKPAYDEKEAPLLRQHTHPARLSQTTESSGRSVLLAQPSLNAGCQTGRQDLIWENDPPAKNSLITFFTQFLIMIILC